MRFHSAMVEPVIEPLRRLLQGVTLSAPTIPYVSCVTGDWIRPEQATSADYWARHAREPVRFAAGVATVSAPVAAILIEVGPGIALSTLAAQTTKDRGVPIVTSLQDSARERDDRDCLLEGLGRAWTYGAAPEWAAIHDGPRSRVSLPTYPLRAHPTLDRHTGDGFCLSLRGAGDGATRDGYTSVINTPGRQRDESESRQ